MNFDSPVLMWGLVAIAVILVVIVVIIIFTGINKTKEVEEELLSEANRLEKKRKCPDDKSLMIKEVINEIVIDKCPNCGGVFLDKNELDIIKRRSGTTVDVTYLIVFFVAIFGGK